MNINLADKELDYIFQVLSTRPWAEVNPLIVKISNQVQEQQYANAISPAGPGRSQPPEPGSVGGGGRPPGYRHPPAAATGGDAPSSAGDASTGPDA